MKNRIFFLMKKKENICFFKKIFCCVRIVNLIFSFDINYSSFFSKNIYGKYDAFFWNGIFTLFGMEFFVSCSFAFYRQRFFEEKCERHRLEEACQSKFLKWDKIKEFMNILRDL